VSHTVDAAAAWIYRGVWASIVALFRVPPEPPTLPSSGETVRSIRPSAGYLRYLKLLFWVALLPGDIVPILIWLAISIAFDRRRRSRRSARVVLIAPDVIAYVGLHLRYDTTWYVFTDRSLRIRRGIWMIRETTITFENVQNVEVAQGPVQRYFGIADVIIQTAGGGAAKKTSHGGEKSSNAHVGILQGLDNADAVRDLILDRVRRRRTAGLGDEHATTPVHTDHTARSEYSTAHLAVLREIRDQALRLAEVASP
jgi:uncharacterized membrane protein YdbT with pleckstrin-like domain